MPKEFRVIVVEDQPLYRDLLVSSLKDCPSITVVGAFGASADVFESLKTLKPSVALLDIDLGPGPNGVQTGLEIRKIYPHMGIVLLSNYDEPGILGLIPRLEVSGWCYLLKSSVSTIHVIERTIEAAANGLMVLDPALVHAYQSAPPKSWQELTPRQQDILALIAQGYSNLAISE